MNRIRQYPVFSAIVIVLLLLVTAELVALIIGRQSLASLASDFDLRQRQYRNLLENRVGPTSANARLVAADLEQNSKVLVQMLDTLNVSGSGDLLLFQGVPPSRTDAYFNLATFVERTRQLAATAGVAIDPEERFGFEAYANEGPDADFIEAVFKQRRIAEVILEALFSAKPERLTEVLRDDWERAPDEPGGVRPITRPGANKVVRTFVIDSQVTARVPKVVQTYAFRVSFIGQTGALRSFMNQMASSDLPIVVRSVEVMSQAAPKDRRTRARRDDPMARIANQASALDLPALQAARVPIVDQNLSSFSVTLEFLEIRITPPKPAGGGVP
ncbi:MAG: Amuc_1100 family pilus-like protein [Opitutaceae bacterium]